jgi:hypothetical protein
MPAVITPKDDSRIIPVGAAVQRIQDTSDLAVDKCDAGHVTLHGLRPKRLWAYHSRRSDGCGGLSKKTPAINSIYTRIFL